MNKQIFLLVLALGLATQVKSEVSAEIALQLTQLKETVETSIRSAHTAFNDLHLHLGTHIAHTQQDGEGAIDGVHGSVSAELEAIKERAAGKDISQCTGGREQMINQLPTQLKERLDLCVANHQTEATRIMNDAIYLVDIIITKVHQLEYQLGLCKDGNSDCVSPIITQIEQEFLQLPEKVKGEVNNVNTLFKDLRLAVNGCSEQHVGDFTGYVTDLIDGISTCVDRILAGCIKLCY